MIETINNIAYQEAEPALSVLIPFYRDDPRPLLAALERQNANIEIIAFDDGAPDAALNQGVQDMLHGLKTPAKLITSRRNTGRAAARNHLGRSARADWLLFLDADMRVEEQFLAHWAETLAQTSSDALFGGYAPIKTICTAHQVHAALSHASDVNDAQTRSHLGAVAVCSSNLAIHKALFGKVPFDEGYQGWGWEDVDWALSADQHGVLSHVDIPAAHDGLQDVDTLLEKFGVAGMNFKRLLDRHPDYKRQKGAKLARLIRHTKLAGAAKGIGQRLARFEAAPVGLRVFALKLFRAAAAAKALQ